MGGGNGAKAASK
ncbi:hypothetical protein V491_03678, partial [Pseudogymnoascus sp. VKM F-3775]